jgi:hypothetical protein
MTNLMEFSFDPPIKYSLVKALLIIKNVLGLLNFDLTKKCSSPNPTPGHKVCTYEKPVLTGAFVSSMNRTKKQVL